MPCAYTNVLYRARPRPSVGALRGTPMKVRLYFTEGIPARAVFEKEGRSVAYVARARGGWDERLVRIARRGQEQHILQEGVEPGERVALKDPIPPVK